MALKDHPTELPGCLGYYHIIPSDDNFGFFGIAQVKPITTILDDAPNRCDIGKVSVYGFHEWDSVNQICSCGSEEMPDLTFGHHLINMLSLKAVHVVKDVMPYGFLVYFELHNKEDEFKCCELPHSDCARTLQEIFRLMIEWDYAYTEFGSTEKIAEVCHHMLRELELPQSIKDWVISQVPPEKVEKFLLGDPNARIRNITSDIPDLDPEFDEWLEKMILSTKPLIENPLIEGR